MAKSNPLFVDSTKFHGDRIGTQIELNNVMVYDDEILVVKIIDHSDEEHRVPMQMLNECVYVARVWLSHQKTISYWFEIEKDGQTLLASSRHQARAQYAIIEDWQPQLPNQQAETEAMPVDGANALGIGESPWAADYASTVESLIEKWGL
jgi:hypothetical protein